MPADDLSVEVLSLKLALHRKLFSFIKTGRSEAQVVEFMVNTLHEHFPECYSFYADLSPQSQMKVNHCAPAKELASLPVFDLNQAPAFLGAIRKGGVVAVEDLDSHPYFPSPDARNVGATFGLRARLDFPVGEGEELGGVLSLGHSQARRWSPLEREVLSEVGELCELLLREARARQALRNSESIYRQLAEHIDSVFWMADPENNESIYVSPAYDQIWGVPRKDLKENARAFLDSVVPEDRERVRASFQHHHDGPSVKFYRIQQPNGDIRWIKDRSFPIRDETGRVYRVAGMAEDITPLREAQERLHATQGKIISNAKFAALGEVASGIAHEINNPLAVIQGLAAQLREQIKRSGADFGVMDGLATIEKMSKRIASIIKGLRTFSRQTDHDPLVPANIGLILQETLAICDSGIFSAGVELRTELPVEDWWIRCRASEISQVLLNLVNNAKDAVAQATVRTITVRLERPAGCVRFTVEDTGPGVPEELREKIFQPFFTTKDVGGGTGLGLSISKNIVEAHGGKLFLDTSFGLTKFVVELPAEDK